MTPLSYSDGNLSGRREIRAILLVNRKEKTETDAVASVSVFSSVIRNQRSSGLIFDDSPERPAHPLDDARYEGVAHAEVLETLTHTGIGPVLREALDLIGLVRREDAELLRLGIADDMGGTVHGALAGQHGACWLIEGIWKSNRAFGIDIGVASLCDTLHSLCTFEVLPLMDIFWEVVFGVDAFIEQAAECRHGPPPVSRDGFHGPEFPVFHEACGLEWEVEGDR